MELNVTVEDAGDFSATLIVVHLEGLVLQLTFELDDGDKLFSDDVFARLLLLVVHIDLQVGLRGDRESQFLHAPGRVLATLFDSLGTLELRAALDGHIR